MKYKILYALSLVMSTLGVGFIIINYGSQLLHSYANSLQYFYLLVFFISILSIIFRYVQQPQRLKERTVWSDAFLLLLYTVLLTEHFSEAFTTSIQWLIFGVILSFIRETSLLNLPYKRALLNPARLFILSFLIIILSGALLLVLPEATYNGISFLDAFFISTSAVCVTGLSVVDIGSHFTFFGKCIILILVQIGALGVLTFVNYFSYFFKGGSSYESQLSLSEINESDQIGEVFRTLRYVILITLTVEAFAAVSIFFSVSSTQFSSPLERLFFSIFHAVTAFCNAGFTTLSGNGVQNEMFMTNYPFQSVLLITFFLGGLGFPIVANIIKYIRHKLKYIIHLEKITHPRIVTLNSKLAIVTTFILLINGSLLFFILEYNNTLQAHTSWVGKIVATLFGATTPRTAGFNFTNMEQMVFPTYMLTILLMWIGASPASTGGGIKTNTFAIAVLNAWSVACGKNHVEIFGREVATSSVRRASATVLLSFVAVFGGISFLGYFDAHLGLKEIIFECFSAYSTCGASLGITSELSSQSRVVIIVLMFVGRVSFLSMMMGFAPTYHHQKYRYPTEAIMIN